MKLSSFRVRDFRSINDSGQIPVEETRTVLVGRNESGKTALLRVLQSLKTPPPDSPVTWGLARDFPRGRRRDAFREDITILETTWTLDNADRAKLAAAWPRVAQATTAHISRTYAPKFAVRFEPLLPLEASATAARSAASSLASQASALSPDDGSAVTAKSAVKALEDALAEDVESAGWATKATAAAQALRSTLAPVGAAALTNASTGLDDVDRALAMVSQDAVKRDAAEKALLAAIPTLVYLDDWTFVPGHYNIDEYLQRKAQPNTLTAQDKLFEKLLKVAELDAAELQQLLAGRHEERKLLTDRASNVVTETIQGLWKDREIWIQFSVDAGHFDVIVKDKDSNALVPLDERSRGFRWYFSFFVTFAADTQGGDKHHAILLLDEPGLFLHAMAQEALLDFFSTMHNQIIYTTHSPFMIPPDHIETTRTVNLVKGDGTTVTTNPTGDANTLFPLQAALGYNLTQTLFIGTDNVVVEGVTDYWYLTATSEYIRENGRHGLAQEIVLTPAGGASKITYMVSLLAAQRLHVAVLLDSDDAGERAVEDMVKSKVLRDTSVVRVLSAFDAPMPLEADTEDLLDPDVYLDLVKECYAKELPGKKMPPLNVHVPRIVRRVEEAFQSIGVAFHKTRPARLFLDKMGKAPASVLTATSIARFERLFDSLNATVAKLKSADRPPFA